MRLQSIASEALQTTEPIEAIKELFLKSEKIGSVCSEEDIETLNHILHVETTAMSNRFNDSVDLRHIENRARIAKTYYDPNSEQFIFI